MDAQLQQRVAAEQATIAAVEARLRAELSRYGF